MKTLNALLLALFMTAATGAVVKTYTDISMIDALSTFTNEWGPWLSSVGVMIAVRIAAKDYPSLMGFSSVKTTYARAFAAAGTSVRFTIVEPLNQVFCTVRFA